MSELRQDLATLDRWAQATGVRFNAKKSLHGDHRPKAFRTPKQKPTLMLGADTVTPSTEATLLGVTLNETCDFNVARGQPGYHLHLLPSHGSGVLRTPQSDQHALHRHRENDIGVRVCPLL